MYELVNTSVPNGLIPGTHGFATVAMTKGMPDAVRTRIESLCAYPHRTSDHDQSYWSKNPVNWFHLTLPNGDHVVGRTAPSEFDYTGRTNRMSHVLHFKTNEMPQIGGVRILAAAAERLSGEWEGDPRYLAADKAMAGRLMMADPPANIMPSNWVSMFGSRGEEFARGFASLLGNNIRGASKGIYFKAATTDMDGTRLLGLFSDLIDMLPVELRPYVTFSTFAPCVPSGTICHLRGIYDKDRTFEATSALQPWVDCESCEVKNPELLPTKTIAEETPKLDHIERQSVCGTDGGHRRTNPFVQRTRSRAAALAQARSRNIKTDPFITGMIVLSVVILLVGAGVVYKMMGLRTKPGKPVQNAPTTRDVGRHERKDKCENEIVTHPERPKVEEMESHMSADLSYQSDKKEIMESEDNVAKPVVSATVRQEEKADKTIKPSLKDLPILGIVSFEKKWIDKLGEDEKNQLCATNALVFYYIANGKRQMMTGRLERKDKPNPRTREVSSTYDVSFDLRVPESALWTVVYAKNIGKTYWQWNKPVEKSIFADKDEVDLSRLIFGDDPEAFELYNNWQRPIIYIVAWKSDNGPCSLFRTDAQLSIDRLAPKESDLKRLSKEIKALEKKIGEVNKEIEDLQEEIREAENEWYPKMGEIVSKYKALKSKENCDAEEKKQMHKLEKNFRELYPKFYKGNKSKPKVEKIDQVDREGLEGLLTNYKSIKKNSIKEKESDLEKLRGQKEVASKQYDEESKNWRPKLKKIEYQIEVISPEKLPSRVKEMYDCNREIDYLKTPTGVNGN